MHILWFLRPWGWLVIVLAGVVGFLHARWVYRRTVPTPTDRVRRFLVGLRTAAVTFLLLALGQPVLLRLLEQREPAVVAVVIEDSGSMALADAATDTAAAAARWSAGWDLAQTIGATVAEAGGGAEVVYLQGNGLRASEATSPIAARLGEPDAVGTDLDALLAQTRQQLLGRAVRGLVLVTDGNATTAAGVDAAPVAAESGAPTWVVGVGDPVGPADRLLTDLRYPEVVFQGEAATIEVAVADRFQLPAAGGSPATVRLRQGGVVTAEATRPGAADLQQFTLRFTPRDVGLQVYTLEASALANERFLGNNQATIVIDVRKDRARLLLLAPQPGWDARFLAQAAEKEPRLALETVHPGERGPVLADSLAAWRAPTTVDGWERWDGVILMGAPGTLVPDATALAQAVRAGMGLLVLAAPPGRGDLGNRADDWPAPLRDLLPVSVTTGGRRGSESFLALAPDAGRHSILAEVAGGGATEPSLSGLPPLRGVRAATVRDDGQTLLVAADASGALEGAPVLVVGPAGAGRVAWFGGWQLWELAFWEPPRDLAADDRQPVRRLLRNLLVWTALGEQQSGVSLLGQRLVYQEGEPVKVEARWLDLRGEPVIDQRLSVRLENEDRPADVARTFSLRPDLTRPGVGTADLPPLPAGRYRVVPIGGGETPLEGQARPLVVTPATVEQTQVRQDRQHLRQLAARAGATYVDAQVPEERQRLVAAMAGLDLAPVVLERQRRWDLWSSWPYLMAVVGLLATEWIVRRRQGML
jgi:hypothetical protein